MDIMRNTGSRVILGDRFFLLYTPFGPGEG